MRKLTLRAQRVISAGFLYPKMLPHQKVFVIPPTFNVSFPDCTRARAIHGEVLSSCCVLCLQAMASASARR